MEPRPTAEELQRTIDCLNDAYDLGIRASTRTPRKQNLTPGNEERLYKKIHFLHFSKSARLARCMEAFHADAQSILSQTTSNAHREAKPNAFGSRKAQLQACLLSILDDDAFAYRPESKRTSIESLESEPKRPRSRSGRSSSEALDQGDTIDSIPVRSSVGPPNTPPPPTGPRFQATIRSYFSTTSSTDRSAPTSNSSSFRSRAEVSTPTSRNTSFSEDYDPYPLCTQECRLMEEAWDVSESAISSDPVTPTEDVHKSPAALKETLRWPKLVLPGLELAPLAVIWEVTRIALHCGVEFESISDLKYEPTESWHDQAALRKRLASHPFCEGKPLPPPSEPKAWELALGPFQSADAAVYLKADLSYASDESEQIYDLRLIPLQLDRGNRLMRRFGADRFLEVTIPSPTETKDLPDLLKRVPEFSEQVIRWLTQNTHRLVGRDWAAFYTSKPKRTAKTSQGKPLSLERIHLFAVGGDNFHTPHTRGSIPSGDEALLPDCRTNMKLSTLLEWTVGIQHNTTEQVAKLFTRIALSLTKTRATAVVAHRDIRHRDKDLGESQHVMNDGAARMSRSLAKKIADHLELGATPAAYQGRFGCAKGMWIVDVQDDGLDGDDWIETYPSQRKWKCPFEDPQHRTFEVKDWSRELRTAALNQQFIPVLETCAVDEDGMRDAIAGHLTNSLRMEIEAGNAALDSPTDMRRWLRQFGQSVESKSHKPFMGGLPSSDEDAVAYLLDAGFDQRKNRFVQDLCVSLVKKKMEMLKSKMNVRVPQSSYLFMVPDFWGILEENEVHVSFSNGFHVHGFYDTLLENMDILVGRSPAHLASDIQRVHVVSHPTLRRLKDVIVMSTKGTMSLAEKLSGGDYDGDKAWVCWDRGIVNTFCNAPVPAGLKVASLVKKNLMEKLDVTVKSLTTRSNADEMCTRFVHTAFRFHMEASLLGTVTNYKERLSYHRGSIEDEKVVWLSNFLSHLVDQGKQGIKFTPDHWARVRKEHLRTPLHYEDPDYLLERRVSKASKLRRLKDHILDHLKFSVGVPAINFALADFEKSIKGSGGECFDGDLTKLANDFEKECTTWMDGKMVYKKLRDDIEKVAKTWAQTMGQQRESLKDYSGKVRQLYEMWMSIVPADDALSSPRINALMEPWVADPKAKRWTLLKASLTFKLFYNRQKFVWRIAGRQLCDLKSLALGAQSGSSYAFVNPEMYACLRPGKSFTTQLAIRESGAETTESTIASVNELYDGDDWVDAYE
ncbi:hypothetical protein JDV02_000606 [Purpureocillium takamizusanense]|uniref:RNA-dependent RNA polymerase n=1 Tax=Purpureocillium takamizusanense TaxID=2060973 RepID=A0A9Q8V710_9HYPO|nr:uncharacterized protein JDV02_000606 [Purpureocillium takamizusanense]UNI13911.1 hypothetical protein JDV02_000606 [Purpureocillium takamizusanense]